MSRLDEALERLPGFEAWTEPQLKAFEAWESKDNRERLCVYYPTGKGKTGIMLTCMYLRHQSEVLVVAPPSTHSKWIEDGAKLGINVTTMSHMKFRNKKTKISRHTAIIIDEFHLLGGHTGMGWKKASTLARHLQAPLIVGSATPNYNDAERVYCVDYVMNPERVKGGFLAWLYDHCLTEQNPFGATPLVTGFKAFKDAEAFLAWLPDVIYIPDDAPDIIQDVHIHVPLPDEFDTLNFDHSRNRVMSSQMEKRHRERFLKIVDTENRGHDLPYTIREEVMEQLQEIFDEHAMESMLIYCDHSSIAEILYDTLVHGADVGLVTGKTTPKKKEELIQHFRSGHLDLLIGTATLATGTDGIDKNCNTMIIVDDTDDNSLRRQLVGRILVRGTVGSNEEKVAYRFIYS